MQTSPGRRCFFRFFFSHFFETSLQKGSDGCRSRPYATETSSPHAWHCVSIIVSHMLDSVLFHFVIRAVILRRALMPCLRDCLAKKSDVKSTEFDMCLSQTLIWPTVFVCVIVLWSSYFWRQWCVSMDRFSNVRAFVFFHRITSVDSIGTKLSLRSSTSRDSLSLRT